MVWARRVKAELCVTRGPELRRQRKWSRQRRAEAGWPALTSSVNPPPSHLCQRLGYQERVWAPRISAVASHSADSVDSRLKLLQDWRRAWMLTMKRATLGADSDESRCVLHCAS